MTYNQRFRVFRRNGAIGLVTAFLLMGCVEFPTGPDENAALRVTTDVGYSAGSSIPGSDAGNRTCITMSDEINRADMHSGSDSLCDQGMGSHYSEAFVSVDSGGILTFFNGNLSIAPESIAQDMTIWARIYRLNRHGFFKRIYNFGPSGTTFDPEAILTLSYSELGPLYPNTLELKVFNETTGFWDVASHMVNHPESKCFVGPIEHFSRYSLSGNGQVLAPEIEES